MLLPSLRALCLAPEGPGSLWNYLGAPVRSAGVSGRIGCGFRTDLHCADGVTATSDDGYRSTMGLDVISLGTRWSAEEKPGSAGGRPGNADHKPGSTGDKPGNTSNHRKAVREIHSLSERCWCARKSELLLIVQRFLKLMHSVCILIHVSIYLCIYIATKSTYDISGLAAGGAWEQLKVHVKMMIK
jgi:hypothetical protein